MDDTDPEVTAPAGKEVSARPKPPPVAKTKPVVKTTTKAVVNWNAAKAITQIVSSICGTAGFCAFLYFIYMMYLAGAWH